MLPIFSEDEFDLEELAADPEEERMFRLYTDFLWKFSNDVAPFSCDGKCQAPSGYFFDEPWITVSSAEMGEDGKSVAVREGGRSGDVVQDLDGIQQGYRRHRK